MTHHDHHPVSLVCFWCPSERTWQDDMWDASSCSIKKISGTHGILQTDTYKIHSIMFLGTVRRQYTSISFFFDPLPPFDSVFCDWLLLSYFTSIKIKGSKVQICTHHAWKVCTNFRKKWQGEWKHAQWQNAKEINGT